MQAQYMFCFEQTEYGTVWGSTVLLYYLYNVLRNIIRNYVAISLPHIPAAYEP